MERRWSDVLGTLGEDDANGELIDDNVEGDLLAEGGVEHELGRVRRVGEDEVGEREVVAEDELGLPATEEREAGSELDGELVLGDGDVRGGDVADFVPVVDLGGAEGNEIEDGADGRARSPLGALVVEARERALELGAVVLHVDVFGDGDVAPVRDLHFSHQFGDGQERLPMKQRLMRMGAQAC